MRKRILLIVASIFFIWVVFAAFYDIYNIVLSNKPGIKMVISRKIGQILNMDAEIKDIKFGLINNIVLDELKLKTESDSYIISAGAEEVIIRYNIGELVLGMIISLVKKDYLTDFSLPHLIIVKQGKFYWRQRDTGLEIKRERIYVVIRSFGSEDARIRITSKETERADEYLSGKVNLANGSFDLSVNFSQTFSGPPGCSLIANGQLIKQASGISPQLDLFIRAKNKYLQAEFTARGNPRRPSLEGRFNLLDRIILPFRGEAAIDDGIIVSFDDGSQHPKVRVMAKFLKSDFDVVVKLKHMNFRNLDIVSELDLTGKIKTKNGPGLVIEGKINSQNSILDYEPFKELNGSYQIKDNLLEILSLNLSNNLALFGYVSLEPPYLADLSLIVKFDSLDELNLPISTFEQFLTAREVEGEFKLLGPIDNPDISGRFETGCGFLEGLGDYEKMNVNLKGKGRILKFSDSRIHKKDGSFIIDGEINFGKKNIFEDLKVGAGEGILVWNDWEVTRERKGSEVKLGKDIGEEFRINFKTYLNDETGHLNNEGNQIELEYELSKGKSIKMHLKEDENFLALEHSFQF